MTERIRESIEANERLFWSLCSSVRPVIVASCEGDWFLLKASDEMLGLKKALIFQRVEFFMRKEVYK